MYALREVAIPFPVESARRRALDIARRVDAGAGPGSLTDDGLHYSVVTGRQLAESMPDVLAGCLLLAHDHANSLAQVVRPGVRVRVAGDLDHVANVNIVEPGGQYEAHVDSYPWVMLLYLDGLTHLDLWDCEDAFERRTRDVGEHVISPCLGDLVVFEGRIRPHRARHRFDTGQPHVSDEPRMAIPIALVEVPRGDVERRGADALQSSNAHIYGVA